MYCQGVETHLLGRSATNRTLLAKIESMLTEIMSMLAKHYTHIINPSMRGW